MRAPLVVGARQGSSARWLPLGDRTKPRTPEPGRYSGATERAEYAAAFLAADAGNAPTAGRAGALLTAGLASWMLGENDRAVVEWREALETAILADAPRETCFADMVQGLAWDWPGMKPSAER